MRIVGCHDGMARRRFVRVWEDTAKVFLDIFFPMKKGAALLEIEDGDETPNPYFGRAASCFQICRDNLCRETINCVGAGLYAFRQDNVTLTKRWRREASQNLTPPAHIIDVRRACDVLTPSGARVNASSNSPVGRAYITFCALRTKKNFC
jgi:hypothetical protein